MAGGIGEGLMPPSILLVTPVMEEVFFKSAFDCTWGVWKASVLLVVSEFGCNAFGAKGL